MFPDSSGWIHAGLGDADKAEVRVKWPGGDWSAPYEVASGQFVILERGKPEPMVWTAPVAVQSLITAN